MSRGLGRIERAILALIADNDAGKSGYAVEALAVAVYQPRKGPKRLPTQAERVAVARAMRSLAHKYHDRIVLKGGDGRPLWLERREAVAFISRRDRRQA
jgi:ribosomal protein L20